MQPHEYRKMYEAEDRYFWFVGKNRLIRAVLEEALAGKTDPAILDIGCGTGGLIEILKGIGLTFGIDHDRAALEFCRKRGLGRLIRMKWEAPAIGPETCDAIVASDFIEHLEDDAKALIEMKNALKRDGKLLITVPSMPWLWSRHDVALGHKRRYTRQSLKRALDMAGLRTIRIFAFMGSLAPVLIPLRFFMKAAAVLKPESKVACADTISYDLPAPINRVFLSVVDAERKWVMEGHDLKMGSTLVALAGKEQG